MATEVRIRRGTTVQHVGFTGAVAEITVDTDKDTVVVHDGVTAGGFPLARETTLSSKANSGANNDITSISGLTTPLSITQGGTGANTAPLARAALGTAVAGANNDITSLTALTAGGLPDNSILTADIANAQITAAKMSGSQTGTAPIFGIRAWLSYDGTGTGNIRASGNVTSVTKVSTGVYTINFTIAMPTISYALVGSAGDAGAGPNAYVTGPQGTPATGSITINVRNDTASLVDQAYVYVIVIG